MARVKQGEAISAADARAINEAALNPPPRNLDAGALLANDAEASKKLLNVLEGADKETAIEHGRAVVFDNANAAREKAPDPRMLPIVERTFKPRDWMTTLDRYDAWLELGDRRTEEAFIRKTHEEGPGIVQALWDCYAQVKYARETWELENDVVFGSMREAASQALEGEKERKIRTKMITEADVEHKCAAMFPDEWARQESKRRRFKLTEDRAKHCIENATLRCRILDSMMARLR